MKSTPKAFARAGAKRCLLGVLLALGLTTAAAAQEGPAVKTLPQTPPMEQPAAPQAEEADPEARAIEKMLRQSRLLRSLGRIDAAFLAYYAVLELDPNNVDALDDLLGVFLEMRNWPLVIQTLEKLISIRPEDRASRELLAAIHEHSDLPERQIPVIGGLLRLDPNNRDYLLSMTKALHEYGLTTEAGRFWKRLHEGAPDNPEYLRRLAESSLDQGRLAESLQWYTRLAEHEPSEAEPQMRIARLALDLGRPRQALAIYRDALEEHPDHELLQEELSHAYAAVARQCYGLGRLGLSKRYFELSRQGPKPYPFAADYLEALEREMSFGVSYAVNRYNYSFIEDVERTTHTAALSIPLHSVFDESQLLVRRHDVGGTKRAPAVDEALWQSRISFHDTLRSSLALGYSLRKGENANGRLLFNASLAWDPTSSYSAYASAARSRVLDTADAVALDLLQTQYALQISRRFLSQRAWTSFVYRHDAYSDGNREISAGLHASAVALSRSLPPEPVDDKPPLKEKMRYSLRFGANVARESFRETSNLYFTVEPRTVYSAEAEITGAPTRNLDVVLFGLVGGSDARETESAARLSLRYSPASRVTADLTYQILEIAATWSGEKTTVVESSLNASLALRF